jgi:hypothetical protein
MQCRDVDKLMDAWLDHQVADPEATDIRAHLAACERCRREWAGLLTLLRDPMPIEVPPGLRDRIVNKLEEESIRSAGRTSIRAGLCEPGDEVRGTRSFSPITGSTGPGSVLARVFGRRNWWRYAAAMAACLAFFMMGWLISGWWAGSHPKPDLTVEAIPQPTPAPITVVVSPWMMSSWMQAIAMPGPVNPAIVLAQGVVPELMVSPPQVDEPAIRVFRKPRLVPSTQPVEPFSGPEMRMVPLIPRYLGA